jgi:glucosamine--fructose-6-phosphate aminotransferase (isomerizing)
MPYDARLKTLVFIFSRSGETSETVEAAEKIKKKVPNSRILAVTAANGAPLLQFVDMPIIIERAREESPIVTKSFTSFLMVSCLIAGLLTQNVQYLQELSKLPALFDLNRFKNEMQRVGGKKFTHVVCCGSGPFYGLAREAGLLAKEMAQVAGEAYHTLEFRHGYQGNMNNPQMLTLFFISKSLLRAESALVGEIAAHQAERMLISDDADSRLSAACNYAFLLKANLSELSEMILMMPLAQLFVFYLAMARGLNPDKPKGFQAVIKLKDRISAE